jgi:hypothetical protein
MSCALLPFAKGYLDAGVKRDETLVVRGDVTGRRCELEASVEEPGENKTRNN